MSKKWVAYGFYLLNLAVIFYFWWNNSGDLLMNGGSGTLIAIARISGLLGMYSVLVQYVLVSRNPLVNSVVSGTDRFHFHHWNGVAALSLVSLHVLFIIFGYSLAAHVSVFTQILNFWKFFPFVWLATITYVIMLITVSLSLDAVRARLGHKLWLSFHIFNHTIVWLAVWHQLRNGGDLLASPLFKAYWVGLILVVLANMIVFRFIARRKVSAFTS